MRDCANEPRARLRAETLLHLRSRESKRAGRDAAKLIYRIAIAAKVIPRRKQKQLARALRETHCGFLSRARGPAL
jgi:hypothetical protein